MRASIIFKTIVLSSVMAFAVGCGKDNKSGSGPAPVPPVFNPYNSGNPFYTPPTQQTSNDSERLRVWYQGTEEPNASEFTRIEKRNQLTFNDPICKDKTYLGFINMESCKNSPATVVKVERSVHAALNTNKSQNTKLRPVFELTQGETLRTISAMPYQMAQGKYLYTLEYVKPNGHILRYLIDTSLNSAFNPVEIYDSELMKGEYVSNPSILR